MKKIMLTFSLLFCLSNILAQYKVYNQPLGIDVYNFPLKYMELEYIHSHTAFQSNNVMTIRKLKIKEVKSTTKSSGSSKNTQEHTKRYNQYGYIDYISSLKRYQKFNYINDTLLNEIIEVNKKDTSKIILRYEVNIPVNVKKFIKGKLVEEKRVELKNENRISMKIFKRNKFIPVTEMRYFYDSLTNKLIRTEYYKKNKLKTVWNYDCNQQGTIVDKKVESHTSCRWEEPLPNGQYVKINRYINKDGEILAKSYFTKDSIWFKSESFKNDTILINKSEQISDAYINSNRSKKDKLTNLYISLNDKEDLVRSKVNIYYSRNKANVWFNEYEYDKKGMIKKASSYWNGKVSNQSTYTISYFE